MNRNKLIIAAIALFALLFSLFTMVAFSKSLSVSARSAAVYEPTTETFIYENNMNARLPMASTTKIMTARVVLRSCDDLSKEITIDERVVGIEGSSAYFKGGEVYTVLDLMHIMMLRSANDVACQLALTFGGDFDTFSDMMNSTASEIGATNTNFTNPSGLDDNGHYTTAHDLALITAAALKHDAFKEIVSKTKYTATELSSGNTHLYVNHNKLLKIYDGCTGVKTGFTKKSGRCLVSAAERDGLTFISVTLDAPNDWSDHTTLLDFGYDTLEKITLSESGEFIYKLPIIDGTKNTLLILRHF